MLCTPTYVKEKGQDPGPLTVILSSRPQGYRLELKDFEMWS